MVNSPQKTWWGRESMRLINIRRGWIWIPIQGNVYCKHCYCHQTPQRYPETKRKWQIRCYWIDLRKFATPDSWGLEKGLSSGQVLALWLLIGMMFIIHEKHPGCWTKTLPMIAMYHDDGGGLSWYQIADLVGSDSIGVHSCWDYYRSRSGTCPTAIHSCHGGLPEFLDQGTVGSGCGYENDWWFTDFTMIIDESYC